VQKFVDEIYLPNQICLNSHKRGGESAFNLASAFVVSLAKRRAPHPNISFYHFTAAALMHDNKNALLHTPSSRNGWRIVSNNAQQAAF
jgi:hypothetical protein